MRILFYLPAVTTWWFDNIILPTMARLHETPSVEIHVMIAPIWRGNGVEAEQLWGARELDRVSWHIIDHENPDLFLDAGHQVPGLLDLVAEIAPDLTIARSADFDTPRTFPGVVRYFMEGDAAPFVDRHRRMMLEARPFQTGLLPPAGALADRCVQMIDPCWNLVAEAALTDRRTSLRERIGLPQGRPVIALSLQYEHHENLFLRHTGQPDGVAAIEAVLAALPDDAVLAVTDHPLNRRYVDRAAVDACMARHGERVVFCQQPNATEMLVASADALIVDLSKSWSMAAFYGTPIVHVGTLPLADWLNAVPGLDALSAALAAGALPRPDPVAARRWFAWHFGARTFYPGTLDLAQTLRKAMDQPSEVDIAANFAVLQQRLEGLRAERKAAA